MTTRSDEPDDVAAREPKQWEIRAAMRAFTRGRDSSARRNPAEQMVAAAWELVAEKDEFTVKELAQRSGVALQTFYRHFGNKDELLLAMLEEGIARGVSRLLAESATYDDPVDRLRALVRQPIIGPYDAAGVRTLRWRGTQRQRLSQLFPKAVEAVHEPYRSALVRAIEDVRSAGLAVSADAGVDGDLILHLVQAMTHLVHVDGIEEAPEAVADRVWHLCWEGLATR